jgi:hypothetical protein
MRLGIWAECASTTTFYANILVNRESEKPPQESMFGVKFKKFSDLKRFGEIVVAITKKGYKERSAIETRCVCLWGYPQNHSDNVYHVLNVKKVSL